MSNFSSLVITNAGKELVAKLQANKDRVTFTSVKTSNQKWDVAKLSEVDNFIGIQSRSIETIEYSDPHRVKILTNFNNIDVIAGYNVNSIGIFAKLDKTTEILYAVATVQDGVGDWMSANGSQNQVSMRFTAVLTVSDLEVESVAIIEVGYVLEADFLVHTSATAIDNVHGANIGSVENSIMARDERGMSKVKYDDQHSTDESVINRAKHKTDINTLRTELTTGYTEADKTLKTEIDNASGQLGQRVTNLENTAITVPLGISKWDPFKDYNDGDLVIVESYDGEGAGLNLIGWDELKAANYQINEIPDIKKWGGDWGSIPFYFIVKSNKGEYTWTLQETIDNIKEDEAGYLMQAEYCSVYEGVTTLMSHQAVLMRLDITGEFGKAELIATNLSIYRQGVNIV